VIRRSREQYVVGKIVYHLGRFSPEQRIDILRQVAARLAGQAACDMEVRVARPSSRGGFALSRDTGRRRIGRRKP
jgi:hypothetical protein